MPCTEPNPPEGGQASLPSARQDHSRAGRELLTPRRPCSRARETARREGSYRVHFGEATAAPINGSTSPRRLREQADGSHGGHRDQIRRDAEGPPTQLLPSDHIRFFETEADEPLHEARRSLPSIWQPLGRRARANRRGHRYRSCWRARTADAGRSPSLPSRGPRRAPSRDPNEASRWPSASATTRDRHRE